MRDGRVEVPPPAQSVTLQCFGTVGNLDLVWIDSTAVSKPPITNSTETVLMSSVYEANITLVDSGRLLGRSIECMSRQSGATASIVFGEHIDIWC